VQFVRPACSYPRSPARSLIFCLVRSVTTRLRCLVLVLTLGFQGCGWRDFFPWSKAELVEWYSKAAPDNPRVRRFGYCGSDAKYHYFIVRPIDWFVCPKVRRSELVIPDERPKSSLPRDQWYFYVVDPAHDFRKVDEAELSK